MSSTGKKKRNPRNKPSPAIAPTPKLIPNPSLPDDLLVSCFARVSRLNYPTLSFVSKRFRSLLASPELYKTRTLLNRAESCLYVYLQLSPHSNPRWFTLCRKPYQNLTNHTSKKKKKIPREYALATLPIPDSPLAQSSGLVALGSNIYNIGRSNVSILDCRSHTWHEAPSMRVERDYAAASVFNGKIYVAGGCNTSISMEVFDPKTKNWESVLSPLVERSGCQITKSVVIEGKIYMLGIGRSTGLAYKPEEDRWEGISGIDYSVLRRRSSCVIDSVLYVYDDSVGIKWLDFNYKTPHWLKLKGLHNFPNYGCVKMVNYGGKLAVFWDVYEPSNGKMIWCAVIALERRNRKEIWGKVEWFNAVLTVPADYQFLCALTATV